MKPSTIFLVFAIFIFCISCTSNNSIPYPSDKALMDKYFLQESAFSSLISDPANQDRLDRLGIIAGYSLTEKTPVDTFIVWRRDLFGPGGYAKGYHYSEHTPRVLVDNIDTIYNNRPADQLEVFRRIKGPWYIYYSASN